jgi:hypothetical protein
MILYLRQTWVSIPVKDANYVVANDELGDTRNAQCCLLFTELQEASQARRKACDCGDDKRLAIHWLHARSSPRLLARCR